MTLEDDERPGGPVISITPGNVEKISQLVHEDRRRIKDIVDVDLSSGIVQANLNMRRVSAKFVSSFLITEQREHYIKVCQRQRREELVLLVKARGEAAVVTMRNPFISTKMG